MTDEKQVTCIVCPIGCNIVVKYNGISFDSFSGYKCKKGIDYAKNEVLNPCRIVTSSVLVKGGNWPLVSVKSSLPVPKEKVFLVLDEIKNVVVKAPVISGQIIIKDVADTNIDIVATKSIKNYCEI